MRIRPLPLWRRRLFIGIILLVLCAVIGGPTRAVSGLVGKSVNHVLAQLQTAIGNGPQGNAHQPESTSSSELQFSSDPAIIGQGAAGAPGSDEYVAGSGGSQGNGLASQSDNDAPSHTPPGFGGGGSFGPHGFALGHSGGGFGGGALGGLGGGSGAPGADPEHGLTPPDPLDDLTPLLTAANDSSDTDESFSPPSGGDGDTDADDPGSSPQGPPDQPPSIDGGDDASSPSIGSPSPNSPELIAFDEDLPFVTSDVPETETVTQSETDAAALPEPSSLALVAFGLYAYEARRRRRADRKI